MFIRLYLLVCFFYTLIHTSFGQITPPGMGKTNSAAWFALGFDQEIPKVEGLRSFTYMGIGRVSSFSGNNMFDKPGIIVFNEEIYHRFHNNWEYSGALSYRCQQVYNGTGFFDHLQQEIRIYGRVSYMLDKPLFNLKITARQEFRAFFDERFGLSKEDMQLRSRIKSQLRLNLDPRKNFRITLSAEALFGTTHENLPKKRWHPFHYNESRFCIYLSYAPSKFFLQFNVGYMNDLVGAGASLFDSHYIAIDIVFKNIFSHQRMPSDIR